MNLFSPPPCFHFFSSSSSSFSISERDNTGVNESGNLNGLERCYKMVKCNSRLKKVKWLTWLLCLVSPFSLNPLTVYNTLLFSYLFFFPLLHSHILYSVILGTTVTFVTASQLSQKSCTIDEVIPFESFTRIHRIVNWYSIIGHFYYKSKVCKDMEGVPF